MKFFTSDLHIGHKRICELTNRGLFTTPDSHSNYIRELWNSTVGAGDIVYHLGDFYFGKNSLYISEYIKSLNGQKIFIKGNHDSREVLNSLVQRGSIEAWYDYKEIKIADHPVCLFHFPISSWHKQHHGAFHLHGHSHGSFKGQGKILDVGLDTAYILYGEHKLLSETEIIEYMKDQPIYIADQHRK